MYTGPHMPNRDCPIYEFRKNLIPSVCNRLHSHYNARVRSRQRETPQQPDQCAVVNSDTKDGTPNAFLLLRLLPQRHAVSDDPKNHSSCHG
jgi:hypothetical protein